MRFTYKARSRIARVIGPALIVAITLIVPAGTASSATGPVNTFGMPPAPTDLPQSYIAGFHLSTHVAHPGDRITGTITPHVGFCGPNAASPYYCYSGTDWAAAGATCHPRVLICTWTAGEGSDDPQWLGVDMPILNGVGPAHSVDFYTVVDKNVYVLDGHVKDTAGNPLASINVDITGKKIRHLKTDATGYYNVFLPKGAYTVDITTGSALGDRWFNPRSKQVTLRNFATEDFTGADHTAVSFNHPSIAADGQQTAVVTIKDLNPLGQGLPSQSVKVTTTGPRVLVCSAMPSYTGRIEPTDVIQGQPINLDVTAKTDAQGSLTFQVYAGTEVGTLDIAADVASNAGVTNLTGYSTASLNLTQDAWASAFPTAFPVTVYSSSGVSNKTSLPLTQVLWYAMHGRTGVTPTLSFPGAPLDEQRELLRWVADHLILVSQSLGPLAHLEIAPVSGAGGANPAVLIFVHGNRSRNRVLDLTTINALIATATLPSSGDDLPTLNDWEANIIKGSSIPDYVAPAPEQGLTYDGFPYLPGDAGAYAAFQATCLQKAT